MRLVLPDLPSSRDLTALDTPRGPATFQELRAGARRWGARLLAQGLEPGEVVGLAGTLGRAWVEAFHGVILARGVPAPLNPVWTPRERDGALEVLGVGRVLCPEESPEPPPEKSPGADLRPPEVDVPVVRLLTSGTSGSPEAVTLTAGNLMASARASRERLALGSGDRWLASLSPAHVGGIALLTRGALLGSTLVLRGSFRPDIFLELAQEGRITHASLVPTMLQRILEAWGSRPAPPSLRCILMGGAASPRELVEEALALGFPLALTYGLTEASSQVATAPPRLVRRKPGTVGPPLPGVRLRLGKDGEILLKGPTVAPGWAGPDGWLHTGDLARFDDQGHLWIVGRLSERIISGGVNVDPLEVEEVLAAHDGVREVAVVGVPDPTWGERVVAAVVSLPEGSPSAAGLEALARANLSPAKRPREVRFLEALPRNTNGKVDRGRVRTILAGG